MLFQQFSRDLHLAIACKPKIIRVHTFWGMFFLLWSNEISTFFDLLMDQGAHFVTVHAFGSIFGESFFWVGLTKYKQIWFFDRFVCCIGRPFNHHSWAFWNHQPIENIEIAQGFSYFSETRPNHIECMLPTIGHSWAFRNHRQIAKC